MNCQQLATHLWNRCQSQMAKVRRKLTQDFDYSDSDFFFGLDVMMAIAGARWKSKNAKLQRLWNLYHWIIYLPSILIFWNTFSNVQNSVSLEIQLSSLQASLAMFITILRMGFILWHYEPLMEVRRYVNRRKFGRDLEQSLEVRRKAFYSIRKIVTYGFGCMFVFGVGIASLDVSNNHIFKLPFNIGQSFPWRQFFCEKAANIWIIGTALFGALNVLIVCMVLAGLTAEATVIAQMFADIYDNTSRHIEQELESNPGNSRQQAQNEEFLFWKYLQEKFNECIDLNIEFLAIKNKIRPALNANFLITYYSTVVTLASGAIYLTQMKAVTLFSLLTLFYCVWVVIECALLTRLVNLATEATESIGREVYNLEWTSKLQYEKRFHVEYRSVRTAIMTVIAVSRLPLRLNCFGFFEFTQEQFWILLNMTYNLYTFFRNFV